MTDKVAGTMSLPAGSFELKELETVGNKVAKADARDKERLARDELAAKNKRPDTESEPGRLPGHKTVERTRALTDDKDGPTVTESIQVFDPRKADKETAAAEGATAPATATTTGAAAGASDTKKG